MTIDAMGTQKDIAEQIIEGEGDYVLALKGNHSRLHGDVRIFFEEAIYSPGLHRIEHESDRQVDGGHGRIEVRRGWATEDAVWLPRAEQGPGLKSIAMVEARRNEDRWNEEAGRRVKRRYYVSSLPVDT